MTRENYFAFKKALKGFVCNITKKGDYITIKPDECDEFGTMNVLIKYLNDAGIEYDFEKFIVTPSYIMLDTKLWTK